MKTTIINIKTDADVKKNAQKLVGDLGLSLSAIINAYLRSIIRNKEVYFSVVPKMSLELENLLGKVEFDIRKNRNLSKAVSDKKELKSYLSSL
ncbi:MAG: type II toxin-antitoxin system RelB/DinJ family antitoxin [Patescibacteria group bacterium]|nr:type II toxin-antitoxin system RelB/DinJ family antitoxin [Patescibacteria group bacterium]